MMGHMKMCAVHKVAWLLLWVGGINWGLIGVLNFNLVDSALGAGSTASRVVYVLVGVSALMMCLVGKCKACSEGCEMKKM